MKHLWLLSILLMVGCASRGGEQFDPKLVDHRFQIVRYEVDDRNFEFTVWRDKDTGQEIVCVHRYSGSPTCFLSAHGRP